jgi:electron transport complex protein RnfC
MGLMPLEMVAYTRGDNLDQASDFGLRDCILCGCCSYVCPSHIPLVQYFQYAMGKRDEQRNAARKNDFIKQATDARARRLADEAALKAAKKNRVKPVASNQEVQP